MHRGDRERAACRWSRTRAPTSADTARTRSCTASADVAALTAQFTALHEDRALLGAAARRRVWDRARLHVDRAGERLLEVYEDVVAERGRPSDQPGGLSPARLACGCPLPRAALTRPARRDQRADRGCSARSGASPRSASCRPGIEPRQLEIGAAATHVMVDAPESFVTDRGGPEQDFPTYMKRATLYANLIGEPAAARADRQGGWACRPTRSPRCRASPTGVERDLREPDSEQRANQILVSDEPYRLEIQPDPVIRRSSTSTPRRRPRPRRCGSANAAVAALTRLPPDAGRRDGAALARQPT